MSFDSLEDFKIEKLEDRMKDKFQSLTIQSLKKSSKLKMYSDLKCDFGREKYLSFISDVSLHIASWLRHFNWNYN
jgi:hypothetical protein